MLQNIFEHRLAAEPSAKQQKREKGVNDRRLNLDEAFVMKPDRQRAEKHA